MAVASISAPLSLMGVLRRLSLLAVALVLSVSLVACSGEQTRKPPTISPEDMTLIARQTEGFLAAKERLPELADLVNERNWVFTRNLIHGPMQDLGRQMLYINQRLLPADRAEAAKRATKLKASLAKLDEAARLQDGENLRKDYIKVATGFSSYAEVIPAEAIALAESFSAEAKVSNAVPPAPSPNTPAPQPVASGDA
ncbi:photosystem II protein PsbQ [Cyanobium sp. N.Huapi 1H5]|nr:photosystem II protein PsbQ [Cyanobacteria bacterium K_Offshore_surface_m2_011]MCP9836349.1 photosystem II protein PsbQ [Cyanobium sp. N.Huapi 1H5]